MRFGAGVCAGRKHSTRLSGYLRQRQRGPLSYNLETARSGADGAPCRGNDAAQYSAGLPREYCVWVCRRRQRRLRFASAPSDSASFRASSPTKQRGGLSQPTLPRLGIAGGPTARIAPREGTQPTTARVSERRRPGTAATTPTTRMGWDSSETDSRAGPRSAGGSYRKSILLLDTELRGW